MVSVAKDAVNNYEKFIQLFEESFANRRAIYAFSRRLNRLYGYTVAFHKSGKPQPVRGFPSRGLIWSRMLPLKDSARIPPQTIEEQWKALVVQGLRNRAAMLEITPSIDPQYLFPNYLR